MIDPYTANLFYQSQQERHMSLPPITQCSNCSKNYAAHLDHCPRCKAETKRYTTDGEKIVEKPKKQSSEYDKRSAKVRRAIKPGTEERLFTSLKDRMRKDEDKTT